MSEFLSGVEQPLWVRWGCPLVSSATDTQDLILRTCHFNLRILIGTEPCHFNWCFPGFGLIGIRVFEILVYLDTVRPKKILFFSTKPLSEFLPKREKN